MATITEILGAQNFGTYAIVHVLLDNQEEAEVYVGGSVETFFDPKHNKVKAFIKKNRDKLK